MNDDDSPKDCLRPTDEFDRLLDRYPAFGILLRVLHNHRRLTACKKQKWPADLLAGEESFREEALEELCDAVPYDFENGLYNFSDVVGTFGMEILRPHETGKLDA